MYTDGFVVYGDVFLSKALKHMFDRCWNV